VIIDKGPSFMNWRVVAELAIGGSTISSNHESPIQKSIED